MLTTRTPGADHWAATSIRSVVGVAVISVTPARSMNRATAYPSTAAARSSIASRSPQARPTQSSNPNTSKAGDVSPSITSSGRIPGVIRIAATKAARFAWVTSTPLGRPVEPEVYST